MNEPPRTANNPKSASTPRDKPPHTYKLVFSALRTHSNKPLSIEKDPKGPSKFASPTRPPKQTYYQLVHPHKMTTPRSQQTNRQEGVAEPPKALGQSNRQDLRIDLKSFRQTHTAFPFTFPKTEDTI